ncbi:MAG: protein kinase [Pirellulales bacterium]
MTETPRPEGRTPSKDPDPQQQPDPSNDPRRIDDKKTRPSDSLDGTQGFAATLPSEGNISWDGKSSPPVERIGRYLLLEELGSGSFGVVYRALDEVLKRFVAVKLLSRFIDAGEVDSWMHEAQVLASLDHPAIVPVYDIGKTGADRPYIVSKYIGGGTLAQRVTPGGSSAADVVKIVTQLAEALHYLHRRGVMHRDIKPGNILMTEDDNAVLADFGLALPESGYGRGARFVGTPAYMSPEQARREGHRVDGRSDIYSLGVVFYELLTGTRPFRASNQEDLLDCIRSVDVRPPRQLKTSVPKELERICLKALSKKVSDRYSTAGDLVEDLKNWQHSAPMLSTIGVSGMHAEANSPAASPSTPLSSPHSSQRSLDIHNVAVIPHGLRPFDAADSDFFKYLLPGARDRNGIPDSISFWTTRIRNREPDETFRVGVLLGPSGSGKSSLMRAGVLPLVASEVNAVYVEAKPEQLEGNLFKQIVHRVPHLKPEQGLREALIRYRQRHQETDGRKLLIVIDQFEQWLNHHREDQTSELHEALRQCDGVHIQAVLLVRDDFMLGLSVFMDQIEELLLQNRNFATVEPFGSSHAREVLAAFGRAYGELSDVLTPEQQKFLEEAIDDLQRLGKIEPVQLALLSEMMKDKPWTAATLKRLGGTQGLGVAFLNDRLLGSSAHPLIRSEADAVQRILAELLPADDTVIKPPATPEHVIMERLRGLKSDETLSRLMQLLDTEVRLLTPTSSSSSQGSTTGSTSGEPAYQLTHDYLVPTIRRWLQSLNQSSRSGRVRRQLRDIAAAWNALPSPKRLPSIIEWASIRALTSKRDWTDAESRMMRTMEKRLGAGTLIVSTSIAALLGGGYYAYVQSRSEDIVSRLKEADTQEVAGVLSLVDQYRSWVLPKLANIPLQDNPQIDADESRRRFHAALAQLDEKPEAVDLLYRKLGTIEDRKVEPALRAAQKHSHLSPQSLIERLKQAISSPTGDVLPAAAMAAAVQPNHEVWTQAAEPICRKLAEKRSNQLEHWLPMLRPVGRQLLPTILRLGDQAAARAESAA